MRKLLLIGLLVYGLITLGNIASSYKDTVVTPTPIISPTDSQEPTEIPLPTAAPITYTEIGPGESVRVPCGEGNTGNLVKFDKSFAGNIGLGGQADITASVIDTTGQPAGGLVEWTLFYRGTLQIDGCNAVFIAPDSIGTARSTSASIHARIVPEVTPTSASQSYGEGGPINAPAVASAKVTIHNDSGGESTCFNPAGVAISVNSVPTTSNVQILVDTPRFLGRQYNSRNATVRDGPGTYEIQIFVNGAPYRTTSSTVSNCQLPTVRF